MFEVFLSREAEKIYLKATLKTTRLLDQCFRDLEESPTMRQVSFASAVESTASLRIVDRLSGKSISHE